MTSKIRKIGNSHGIVIPKKLLEEAGINPGSDVVVEKKNGALTITPEKHTNSGGVDPKFVKIVDDFIEEHKDVLKELAKK